MYARKRRGRHISATLLRRWPLLAGVYDPEDARPLRSDLINQHIWRAGDHEFARIRLEAWAAGTGLLAKRAGDLFNTINHGDAGGRTVLTDVVPQGDEVALRRRRPP